MLKVLNHLIVSRGTKNWFHVKQVAPNINLLSYFLI